MPVLVTTGFVRVVVRPTDRLGTRTGTRPPPFHIIRPLSLQTVERLHSPNAVVNIQQDGGGYVQAFPMFGC